VPVGAWSAAINDLNNSNLSVVGIERDRLFFIPTTDEQIQKDDLIYLFGSTQAIKPVLEKLDSKMPSSIKKVAIFGANKLSQEIAKVLVENKVEVKIIAKNVLQCEEALQELQGRVSVINSSYEDHRFFDEEGIKNADMVISTNSEDEKNIIKCIEAKEHGIEKVVAINNDAEYYNLMHKLGVIALRGNKSEAHYAILEKISSSLVVKHRQFCGGSGVVFTRRIYSDSKLIGKTIKPLNIQNTILLLLRGGEIHREIPAETTILQDDIFVLFGTKSDKQEMQTWIYSL